VTAGDQPRLARTLTSRPGLPLRGVGRSLRVYATAAALPHQGEGVHVRPLSWLLTVSLSVATSVAVAQGNCSPAPCPGGAPVEMQFTFQVVPTGEGGDGWPANVWNVPGPIPVTLQETFFVDPASVTGSYTTEPGQQGGLLLSHIDESFTASNITLTANGLLLQQSATGAFSIFGDRASDAAAGSIFFGGVAVPGGGGGSDFFSANAQAPPDWAAFLSTTTFGTDTGLFTLSGTFGQLDVVPDGRAVVSAVSVPEPALAPLWALGAAILGAMHLRRRRASDNASRVIRVRALGATKHV
jgi:hypothetical protein